MSEPTLHEVMAESVAVRRQVNNIARDLPRSGRLEWVRLCFALPYGAILRLPLVTNAVRG